MQIALQKNNKTIWMTINKINNNNLSNKVNNIQM
jgi:hypothetical protein